MLCCVVLCCVCVCVAGGGLGECDGATWICVQGRFVNKTRFNHTSALCLGSRGRRQTCDHCDFYLMQ